VKSALEELRDIDNLSVTMTTSGTTRTYTVTFAGVLAGKNVPLVQAAAMPAVSGAQQGAIDYKYNPAGLLSEGGDSSARYTWAYDQLNRQTSETADLDPANPLNSIVSLTRASGPSSPLGSPISRRVERARRGPTSAACSSTTIWTG
jgi:hypothetical protein